MTDYLPHDVDARDDYKVQALQIKMRGQGYAIFWALLELLWKNDGKMPYNPDMLAFSIRWCTPEEVEQVVTGFGLFEVQDGYFWSSSLLKRLGLRNAEGERRRENARKAGNASAAARNSAAVEQPLNESSTPVEQPLNDFQPTNKLTNKLTKEYSSSAPAQARAREAAAKARIFEIFFFRNCLDPSAEVDRFWNYYAASGWMLSEGKPVKDKVALAAGWTSEDKKPRFDRDDLVWYEGFYSKISKCKPDAMRFLVDFEGFKRDEKGVLILRYSNKATAQEVADWCATSDLFSRVQVQVARKWK